MGWETIPTIETPRLALTPMNAGDGGAVWRWYTEEIARYQYPQPYASPEEAAAVIQRFAEDPGGNSVLFAIRDRDGLFLGEADIHGLSKAEPELGVWIRQDRWRQGYAGEAVSALLCEYGKRGYTSFRWEADRRNPASLRLAESLGGVLRGTDEYETMRGDLLKLNVYSIPAPAAGDA